LPPVPTEEDSELSEAVGGDKKSDEGGDAAKVDSAGATDGGATSTEPSKSETEPGRCHF